MKVTPAYAYAGQPWHTLHMTVLVVEDEARLESSLVKGLIEAGFPSLAAGTAAEALSLALEGGLRAIVLDLGLPDRDGQEVIAELRPRGARASTSSVDSRPWSKVF